MKFKVKNIIGKWKVNKANRALAKSVQKAMSRLRAARKRGSVRIEHVRAHRGEPGNEVADDAAKSAARGDLEEPLQRARDLYRRMCRSLGNPPSPTSTSTPTSTPTSTARPAPESLSVSPPGGPEAGRQGTPPTTSTSFTVQPGPESLSASPPGSPEADRLNPSTSARKGDG